MPFLLVSNWSLFTFRCSLFIVYLYTVQAEIADGLLKHLTRLAAQVKKIKTDALNDTLSDTFTLDIHTEIRDIHTEDRLKYETCRAH